MIQALPCRRRDPPGLWALEEFSLFLDLDGTILDIASAPGAVRTEPGLVATLHNLQGQLDGALAIVSGRSIAEIDRLLSPLHCVAAGVHGCELRVKSDGIAKSLSPPVPVEILTQLTDRLSGLAGVLIEDKGCAVAVHYRSAPAAGPVIEARISELPLRECGLVVLRGRKVFEIFPAGRSKLAAIKAIRELRPFVGRWPIVIGDDLTDEAAIVAANAWGGYGLRVAGEHFPRTQADFTNPADVRAWLQSLVSDTINSMHHAARL